MKNYSQNRYKTIKVTPNLVCSFAVAYVNGLNQFAKNETLQKKRKKIN